MALQDTDLLLVQRSSASYKMPASELSTYVGGGNSSVTVSPTAPSDPENGDMWWNSEDGNLYIYYTDPDSSQWVPSNSEGSGFANSSVGPNVPAAASAGDLWFSTNDARLYVYDGSVWIDAAPTGSIPDGGVTPAKLSTGGPNWDASGNVTSDGSITAVGNIASNQKINAGGPVAHTDVAFYGANNIADADTSTFRAYNAASGGLVWGGYNAAGSALTSKIFEDGSITTADSVTAANGRIRIGPAAACICDPVNDRGLVIGFSSLVPTDAAGDPTNGEVDLGDVNSQFKNGYFAGTITAAGDVTFTESTTEAWSLSIGGANSYFKIRDEYNSSDRLTIDNEGKVSLGSITAAGTAKFGSWSGTTTNDGDGAYIYPSGSYQSNVQDGETSTFIGRLNGQPTATILGDGRIRTRGIFGKQGVNGNDSTSTNNFYWNGSAMQLWVDTVNLGNLNYTSDYRVKRDIQPIESDAASRIKALNPVSFKRADYGTVFKRTESTFEGFIAHEVQEVIPSGATGTKDCENEVQSLRLDAILAVTVKALQESLTRIEALESRISQLEAEKE